MPGSVSGAAPATVLPYSLASAFQQSREYLVVQNRYRNGETQQTAITATSRKRWPITRPLTAAQWTALLSFFTARLGGLEEFYFYDVYETSPQFSYDDTGAATQGRYSTRFEGGLQLTLNLPRHQTAFALVEVS